MTESKNRKHSTSSSSQARSSKLYHHEDDRETDKGLDDRSSSNIAQILEHHHQSSEQTNEQTTDLQSDLPMPDANESADGSFGDGEQGEYDGRNENGPDQASSPTVHTREPQFRLKNVQSFGTQNSYAARQSDRSRSESPQKDRQSKRDHKLNSPGNRPVREAEDIDLKGEDINRDWEHVQHRMAGGLSSLDQKSKKPTLTSHSQRHNNDSSASPSQKRDNRAPESRSNTGESGHYRDGHTHESSSRNRTKKSTRTSPSKPASQPVSSDRRETYQEAQRPKLEVKHPVIERAENYIKTMRIKGSSSFEDYFMGFAQEMQGWIEQSEDRVSKLSEEMLAGRDRYQPIPDGEFQALMTSLREKVRALARGFHNAAKGAKMQGNEYRIILEGAILSSRINENGWEDKRKMYFIQSAIWRVLHDHLFDDPFQVFGNEGPEVARTWTLLFPEGKARTQIDDSQSISPIPTELSEKWKSLSAIRLEEKYPYDIKSCQKVADLIVDTLARPLRVKECNSDEDWAIKLYDMLRIAAKLATDMAKQRSRLVLYVPNVAILQRQKNMDRDVHALGKILDVDDEDSIRGDIMYVVTPGLRRWGDGLGQNLNRHVDLEAAQVRCIEYD